MTGRKKAKMIHARGLSGGKQEEDDLICTENRRRGAAGKIFCALALIALWAGLSLSLVGCSGAGFSYLDADLDKYVTISEENYKNYTAHPVIDEVTNADVDMEIYKLIVKHKDTDPQFGGNTVKTRPVSLGDIAYIYYRGYTVDENGVETDLNNTSNMTKTSPDTLEIGSGSFVRGFESGLLGVIPNDTRMFTKRTEGKVEEGDLVYVSYVGIYPDGRNESATLRKIDLNNPGNEKTYGKELIEHIKGATIGETHEGNIISKIPDKGDAIFYRIKVLFTAKPDEDTHTTVETYFPYNYSDESFRQKTVRFDVYVNETIIYNTKEWNDEFVTDTLGVKAEDLAEYEGETLADKYREKVRADLVKTYEDNRKSLIEDAMWTHYIECAKVKKLPESEVRTAYDGYITEAQNYYNGSSSAQSTYGTFEKFIVAYYSIGSDTTYEKFLREKAERAVTEKLILYSIAKREGTIPTGDAYTEKYNALVDDMLEYYINYYGYKRENYSSDEAYKEAIDKLREEMIEYYGEDYLENQVYYDATVEKLLTYAKIV